MADGRTLFLDCDGVLADFDGAAVKIFGMPPRLAEERLGSDAFWARIQAKPDFYGGLAVLPDGRALFDAVAHLRPVILTGCPRGGWAEGQKVAWAHEHFPEVRIITCQSAHKRDHMRPGDILIDDYLKYKGPWEEAGGMFLHHTSAASTIVQLRQAGVL